MMLNNIKSTVRKQGMMLRPFKLNKKDVKDCLEIRKMRVTKKYFVVWSGPDKIWISKKDLDNEWPEAVFIGNSKK